MTPLNTIIEEEVTRYKLLTASEVQTVWDEETGDEVFLPNFLTTAIQRAYEAGREERDTHWKERVRKKFIPWEKIEILDNGAIMTIDNKVRLYGFKRMTDPLMYEYDLRKGNQALDTLLDNLK